MSDLLEHQVRPWAAVRAVVFARCGGWCEACGHPLESYHWDGHHRQHRSRGGVDCPCNVVALHPTCHTVAPTSVHQRPAEAEALGLSVASWDDPRSAPVVIPSRVHLLGSGAVHLSCGGTYI